MHDVTLSLSNSFISKNNLHSPLTPYTCRGFCYRYLHVIILPYCTHGLMCWPSPCCSPTTRITTHLVLELCHASHQAITKLLISGWGWGSAERGKTRWIDWMVMTRKIHGSEDLGVVLKGQVCPCVCEGAGGGFTSGAFSVHPVPSNRPRVFVVGRQPPLTPMRPGKEPGAPLNTSQKEGTTGPHNARITPG